MERRDFIRMLPVAALAPKVIEEGVVSFEIPNGTHFAIFVDMTVVDMQRVHEGLSKSWPKDTTACLIGINGNPDDAIKFYKIKES